MSGVGGKLKSGPEGFLNVGRARRTLGDAVKGSVKMKGD